MPVKKEVAHDCKAECADLYKQLAVLKKEVVSLKKEVVSLKKEVSKPAKLVPHSHDKQQEQIDNLKKIISTLGSDSKDSRVDVIVDVLHEIAKGSKLKRKILKIK